MVQVYVPVVFGVPPFVMEVTVLLPLVSVQLTTVGLAFTVHALAKASIVRTADFFIMCIRTSLRF